MIASAMCPMSPCYKGKETEQVYKARKLPKWIEAGIVVTIPRCHSLHDLMRKLSLTQRVICHISQNYKERITKWKKKWYLTLMKMSMASSIYLKQSLRVCSEFCGSKSATILRWWAMSMSIMAVLCCVNNKWLWADNKQHRVEFPEREEVGTRSNFSALKPWPCLMQSCLRISLTCLRRNILIENDTSIWSSPD